MWEAIAYVSSGLTLAAFLAAVIAWSYKAKADERERLIRTAKPEQRADLVRNALEFFNVETSGLTKEQQYNVAIEQIHARAQRFKILVALVGFLSVIAATVAIYAISTTKPQSKNTESARQQPVSRLSTDKSILTIPRDDCIGSPSCPHIFSIAFSPDSRQLIYGDRLGDVRLWSLDTNKETNRFIGLKSSVEKLEFETSGKKILGASSEGVVYIWDLQTGKPETVLSDPDHQYTQAAWSSAGDAIVLGPLMGKLAYWESGSTIKTDFGSFVKSLSISSDGNFVASGQFSKNIALKSIKSGEEAILLTRSDHDFVKLEFSKAGTVLLSGDESGVIRGWDTTTKALLFQTVSPGGGIRDLAFSPDGMMFAVISLNGGIWLFDEKGSRLRELTFKNRDGKSPWANQEGNPWSMAFSPDSKFIVAGSVNGEVIVWSTETGVITQSFVGHLQEQIIMVKFSPNGKLVASACFDGTVKVWRLT